MIQGAETGSLENNRSPIYLNTPADTQSLSYFLKVPALHSARVEMKLHIKAGNIIK